MSVRSWDRGPVGVESPPRVPTRLDAGRREMAAAVWPEAGRLARAFARRKQLSHLSEDMVGTAGEAVCRAATAFDPQGGATWRTWWKSTVWHALHDAARAAGPKGYRRVVRPGGRDEPIPRTWSMSVLQPNADDITYPEPADLAAQEVGWEVEYEDEVRMLARRLPARNGEFLRRMFLDCCGECSPGHAAVAMGYCGYSRGSQLYRQAMAMARKSAARREVFGRLCRIGEDRP